MSCLSRFRLITFDVTDTLIKFRTAPGKQYGEIGALFGVNQDDHHDLVANFRSNWWEKRPWKRASHDILSFFYLSGERWMPVIQISDYEPKSANVNGGVDWSEVIKEALETILK